MFSREQTKQIRSFLKGEITWAEMEGITAHDAQTFAQTGCDLAAAGRLEDARAVFEGLVAVNPKDASAHAALGTIFQKLSKNDEALAAYSLAIKLEPRNPIALANRGELRLKVGDRGGLSDLGLAIEADPSGETVAARRARGLVRAIAMIAAEQEADGQKSS